MSTKAAGAGKRTHRDRAARRGGGCALAIGEKTLSPHALARHYAELVKLREKVRLAEARRAASLPPDPPGWDA